MATDDNDSMKREIWAKQKLLTRLTRNAPRTFYSAPAPEASGEMPAATGRALASEDGTAYTVFTDGSLRRHDKNRRRTQAVTAHERKRRRQPTPRKRGRERSERVD